MRPQRIQLSRRKGFSLQGVSQALNGLSAMSVARPGCWGNPFSIAETAARHKLNRKAAQAEAVRLFRDWAATGAGADLAGRAPPDKGTIKLELAGKNLACWCAPGTPCHADILLELANR